MIKPFKSFISKQIISTRRVKDVSQQNNLFKKMSLKRNRKHKGIMTKSTCLKGFKSKPFPFHEDSCYLYRNQPTEVIFSISLKLSTEA